MTRVVAVIGALVLAWAWATAAWVVSVVRRDAGVMDLFWGPGFLLIGAVSFAGGSEVEARRVIVLALVVIWGLRLAWHIGRRNLGRPEDFRYRAMRERAGGSFWWRSWFSVFLLQGTVMWIVSAPILIVQLAPPGQGAIGALDVVGVAVWAGGFLIETISDLQLSRFRRAPPGEDAFLRHGLWAWTRHPNYFGEALVWWGLWLIAASVPGGVWTVVSPLVMTWLLQRVSGVPLLEARMAARPGWPEYAASTPAFFPRPPRRRPSRGGADEMP